MSKVAMTCLSRIHQRDFISQNQPEDVVVNAVMTILSFCNEAVLLIAIFQCCPGYVDTDMTSHKGHLTIEEGTPDQSIPRILLNFHILTGAKTPIYLALLPANITNPKGKFLYQCKEVDWVEDAGIFAK